MVKTTFKKLGEIYAKKECIILTTETQFLEMASIEKKIGDFKIKFRAKCGHENEQLYANFRNNPNVLCKVCKQSNNIEKLSPLSSNITFIEYEGYKICKKLLQENFQVYRTHDGCSADFFIKPKDDDNINIENLYLGIQLKVCTNVRFRIYTFKNINKPIYQNYCIVCICLADKKIWVFNYFDIQHVRNLSIGYDKSKYNDYLVPIEMFSNKCLEFYKSKNLFTKEFLLVPTAPNMKLEHEYRLRREKYLHFLDFVYYEVDNLVFDFTINGKKHQEKVISYRRNRNNKSVYSVIIKRSNMHSYKKCDNDYYWIWLKDTSIFFIFPESIMIEYGYVDNIINKTMTINMNKLRWKSDYMFDLNNLNKDKIIELLCVNSIANDKCIKMPFMAVPEPYMKEEKQKKQQFCLDCNIKICLESIRCNACNHILLRKVDRPSKEYLSNLLKDTNYVQIGKMYGVSDNAVRKWVKAYDIDISKL